MHRQQIAETPTEPAPAASTGRVDGTGPRVPARSPERTATGDSRPTTHRSRTPFTPSSEIHTSIGAARHSRLGIHRPFRARPHAHFASTQRSRLVHSGLPCGSHTGTGSCTRHRFERRHQVGFHRFLMPLLMIIGVIAWLNLRSGRGSGCPPQEMPLIHHHCDPPAAVTSPAVSCHRESPPQQPPIFSCQVSRGTAKDAGPNRGPFLTRGRVVHLNVGIVHRMIRLIVE